MTLSVLISVYYKEQPNYLDECFKSLYEQTQPADEIVCVKDGTLTSELDSVLLKWEKLLPLKIVGYEENKGLAHALNFGLSYCSGEWIARMDTDDISLKDRFEKQLDFIVANPGTMVLGSAIEERFYRMNQCYHKNIRFYEDNIDKTSELLYRGTPIGHPTALINKKLLQRYLYSETVGANEDIELWFRILHDGYKIRNLSFPLYVQRIDDGMFKRRSSVKAFKEFRIYVKNLYALNGFSFKLIYPCLRLIVRFLPKKCVELIYMSNLRKYVLPYSGISFYQVIK